MRLHRVDADAAPLAVADVVPVVGDGDVVAVVGRPRAAEGDGVGVAASWPKPLQPEAELAGS